MSRIEETAALVSQQSAAEVGLTRRRFLRDAGALAGSAVLAGRFAPLARGAEAPKIAVVGAGLAA
jgi:hypothetical protein